jgi:hypothetical protein
MYRIAATLMLLVTIAAGAKLAADRHASPAATKQPGGQTAIKAAAINTVPAAATSQVADASARSEHAAPTPALPAWLEDPSVMDGSWRKWPSLTDF